MYWILRCLRHTEGATAVEYGLIAGIIGGALILGIGAFSDNLSAMFTTINDLIKV
nr:Flp family type IVb pilin [Rhizobium rhizoryzae]